MLPRKSRFRKEIDSCKHESEMWAQVSGGVIDVLYLRGGDRF